LDRVRLIILLPSFQFADIEDEALREGFLQQVLVEPAQSAPQAWEQGGIRQGIAGPAAWTGQPSRIRDDLHDSTSELSPSLVFTIIAKDAGADCALRHIPTLGLTDERSHGTAKWLRSRRP